MATSGTLSIKLRCASWQQLATIYQRDLSRGTMFLKASSPPALGTMIRIDLTLPSASVIELTGVVEQHVSDQRGAGIELKLSPIADGSIWLIESALASEQRRGTPARGVPVTAGNPRGATPEAVTPAPIASMTDGADVAMAETDLVRALSAEVESLKQLNPFLVLGVGYDASDVDVRRAFGELTKRYHPDRFARYESSELRHVAAEIFILIRDAYRRLCRDDGRAQALSSLGRSKSPAPMELLAIEELIDDGRLDEAFAGYKGLMKKHPQDRSLRAGLELCEGLLALRLHDRLQAARRFEAALEIDPSNERAARELADMRRQATNERRGLLSRLMSRPEGKES
jgi:hypothetical protein